MVKGISKQVIVVHAPDPKLFEQAIFILKENAPAITDEDLLKEAKRLIANPIMAARHTGPVWALCGALAVGIAWLLTLA
jgi:hypothetical protein